MEQTKEQRIKKETRRLTKIFAGCDQNKLDLSKNLIATAAYISVSLKELEAQLNETGWTEEYANGQNQAGMKKSAAADVYISLSKNFTAIVKQLLDIVPPAHRKESKLAAMMSG